MRPWRWAVALATLLFGRLLRRHEPEPDQHPDAAGRRAELVVAVLLGIAALWAIGFIVTYAAFSPRRISNELLGICIAMAFAFTAAALVVLAKQLLPGEELEDDYPQEHPEEQQEIVEVIHDAGSGITRKRLLIGAGAAAGGAISLAALTPALSLGPLLDTGPLDRTPWYRGRRLVDEQGHPILAADVVEQTFYTAFPEGADPEDIGSPLVVLRLDASKLRLPRGRAGWAPDGIIAYSKICTHAGCAIALYRKPTFPVVEPHDALVCPCHYSTFDPFTGGTVIYGPAGRPLPQLPLEIDSAGALRAAGNFSGRVGPAWWNVNSPPTNA